MSGYTFLQLVALAVFIAVLVLDLALIVLDAWYLLWGQRTVTVWLLLWPPRAFVLLGIQVGAVAALCAHLAMSYAALFWD